MVHLCNRAGKENRRTQNMFPLFYPLRKPATDRIHSAGNPDIFLDLYFGHFSQTNPHTPIFIKTPL